MDNLNTHVLSSLYKKYPAQEARSYARRLEVHYTPKHGSWLNIAEIELNVMTRQCLARRLDSISKIHQELKAWENMRNQECEKVIWHFFSTLIEVIHIFGTLVCLSDPSMFFLTEFWITFFTFYLFSIPSHRKYCP